MGYHSGQGAVSGAAVSFVIGRRKAMFRKLFIVAMALTVSACASEEAIRGQAILDFSAPPGALSSARLVMLNGNNITGPASRTSWWVDPGKHEIVVAAAIADVARLGSAPTNRRSAGRGQGSVTIEVEAGKRYNIAARATDATGGWEPVIWRVEDI